MPDPLRNIRVPDALWAAFLHACNRAGTNASTVLRQHMTDYVKENGK